MLVWIRWAGGDGGGTDRCVVVGAGGSTGCRVGLVDGVEVPGDDDHVGRCARDGGDHGRLVVAVCDLLDSDLSIG